MRLYIMLAYLMLFNALLNVVHLYNSNLFFAIDFRKYFVFMLFIWVISLYHIIYILYNDIMK